jgi:DNA-binding transcriptional MocR family regulator
VRGLPTSVDEVLVTTGAQQAVMLSGNLFLQKGDSVLLEDPCYFGALEAFRATGARISTVPVGACGICPQAFRESVAATGARLAYLTTTFQNPTGTVMPGQAREEIVGIAAQHRMQVVDDQTLADIDFGADEARPLAVWDRDGTVLSVGSLGKLMWAGLRIGWIRAARHLIERLVRLKMAYDLGTPLLTQALAVKLFGCYDEAKALRRAELSGKRDLMAALLKEHLPDFQFTLPDGGLFLWARLPSGDARELAQVAMRNGLVLLPGSNMSCEGRHSDVLRIPFLLDEDELREGMRRLILSWHQYTNVSRRRVFLQAIT